MSARSSFLGSQPIRKRRMTISEPNPLPAHAVEKIKQRNFFENIGSSQVQIRRPANSRMFVDRSGFRACNDSNSNGQFESSVAPPLPPVNLNWESSLGSSLSQGVLNEQENPTMEESYYRPVQEPPPRMAMERSGHEPKFGNTHPRMNLKRSIYEAQFGNTHPRMDMDHKNHDPRFGNNHPRMDMERSIDEAQFGNTHPRMDMDHKNHDPRFGNNHTRMNMERSIDEAQFGNNHPRMNMDRDEGFNANGYQRFESDVLEPPSKFKTDFERREPSRDGHDHGGREPVPHTPRILDKMFTIGGFKMPFVTNEPLTSDWRSYAARFFKKLPDYLIRSKPSKEMPMVQHIYNYMISFPDLYDDSQGRLPGYSSSLSDEWTKIYRARNYRTWEGWWKDFRNIDMDINDQLTNFDCFNVKYNFMMPECDSPVAELIKMAIVALQKNRKNYLGNLKIIYTMMDRNVLGNLSMEATAQLQDIIRSVPNHLWIFKLRCMIYVWYHYSQVMKSKDTGDRKYQMVLREWKSPVIHWMAKQAFLELKSISKLEFPQFHELCGADKQF